MIRLPSSPRYERLAGLHRSTYDKAISYVILHGNMTRKKFLKEIFLEVGVHYGWSREPSRKGMIRGLYAILNIGISAVRRAV